jgi:hypothetical protein
MSTLVLAVRVGAAKYGQGVFACRQIRRREKIGRVRGHVIHNPRYGSEYAIDLGGRLLEPSEPFRYLNHSCQPNCELLNFTPPDAARNEYVIYLKALRHIAPGEELTIDYAWSAEAAVPCGCGAPECRRWIVSVDQLPLVLARRGQSP